MTLEQAEVRPTTSAHSEYVDQKREARVCVCGGGGDLTGNIPVIPRTELSNPLWCRTVESQKIHLPKTVMTLVSS